MHGQKNIKMSEGRGFDSRWCHWNFSLTYSFQPHYGPGVDSASNGNKYQEEFPGVKAAGVLRWQPYHLHVQVVLKSGNLKLLETFRPVQACNWIALRFKSCGEIPNIKAGESPPLHVCSPALPIQSSNYTPNMNAVSPFCSLRAHCEMSCRDVKQGTVGYGRTNVSGSRTSFVIAPVRSSIHWNICI